MAKKLELPTDAADDDAPAVEVDVHPVRAWLTGKKANRVTTFLVGDAELAQELQAAQTKQTVAELLVLSDPKDKERQEALEAAESLVEDLLAQGSTTTLKFTFVGLPAGELEAIERSHPPTRDSVKAARQRAATSGVPPTLPDVEQDTYIPTLWSRSCIDPIMDLVTATELYNDERLNVGERNKLIQAVMMAQMDPSRRGA